MGRGVDNPQLRKRLGVASFQERWPWIGGDLQTLRDTLREVDLPSDQGVPIHIPVPGPSQWSGRCRGFAGVARSAGRGTQRHGAASAWGWGDPVPGKA